MNQLTTADPLLLVSAPHEERLAKQHHGHSTHGHDGQDLLKCSLQTRHNTLQHKLQIKGYPVKHSTTRILNCTTSSHSTLSTTLVHAVTSRCRLWIFGSFPHNIGLSCQHYGHLGKRYHHQQFLQIALQRRYNVSDLREKKTVYVYVYGNFSVNFVVVMFMY